MIYLKNKKLLVTLALVILSTNTLVGFTLFPSTVDTRSRSVAMYPPGSASLVAPSPGTFIGIDGIRELAGSTITAPDPQVAAGPNHVVEMANLMVEIFSKSGVSLQNETFASFFNVSASSGDPRVIYDASSGRWFATSMDGKLAVSNSTDPTGTWKLYSLPCASFDNPSLGVSDDKVVISNNPDGDGGSRSLVCVANKTELVAGSSNLDFVSFSLPFLSVHPVQSLSPTSTQYLVSTGIVPTNV